MVVVVETTRGRCEPAEVIEGEQDPHLCLMFTDMWMPSSCLPLASPQELIQCLSVPFAIAIVQA